MFFTSKKIDNLQICRGRKIIPAKKLYFVFPVSQTQELFLAYSLASGMPDDKDALIIFCIGGITVYTRD